MTKLILLTIFIVLLSSCSHIQVAMFKYEDLCQEDIMKGRYDNAKSSCGLCNDYNTSAICANNLGIVFTSLHFDFEKAKDQFEEALHIDDTFVQSYNNLGVIYHMTGDYNKAISYYKTALELEPDYYDSLYNLSRAYRILGNLELEKYWMNKAEVARGI